MDGSWLSPSCLFLQSARAQLHAANVFAIIYLGTSPPMFISTLQSSCMASLLWALPTPIPKAHPPHADAPSIAQQCHDTGSSGTGAELNSALSTLGYRCCYQHGEIEREELIPRTKSTCCFVFIFLFSQCMLQDISKNTFSSPAPIIIFYFKSPRTRGLCTSTQC